MKTATTPVTTPPRQDKPYPDFPLYWHKKGYWMKKHRGKELRFTADAAASLQMWKEIESKGISERAPRRSYTVRDAINAYLTRQKRRFEDGELGAVQFARCRKELETELLAVRGVALGTHLSDFNSETPADGRPGELFGRIRTRAVRRGLQAAHKHITLVRAMLDYAARRKLMRAADFGDDFDPPSKDLMDRERHARDAEQGERAWTIDEIKAILDHAREKHPRTYAQMLLALYAGFGSDDCSALPRGALMPDRGIVKFPRVKNGRPRVAALTPRVFDAIAAARKVKARAPQRNEWSKLVFLTKAGRKCNIAKQKHDDKGLLRAGRNDTIGKNFTRMVANIKMGRPRAGFKTLRAMCRTMLMGAGVDGDVIAVIMGRRFRHAVDEYYIRGELKAELVKASLHIESQLFPTQTQ